MSKTCTKCGETKPLDDFHRDKGRVDGRRPDCKECVRDHQRRYREENRDKVREYQRRYREENRDELREHHRRYHKENLGKWREYTRRYREENREKVLEMRRRYYGENVDYMRAQEGERRRSRNVTSALFATKRGEPYTPDEDAFLMADNGMTTYQKAMELGRTYASCSSRRGLLRARANH